MNITKKGYTVDIAYNDTDAVINLLMCKTLYASRSTYLNIEKVNGTEAQLGYLDHSFVVHLKRKSLFHKLAVIQMMLS